MTRCEAGQRLTEEQEALILFGNALKKAGSLRKLRAEFAQDERDPLSAADQTRALLTKFREQILKRLLIEPMRDEKRWEKLASTPFEFQKSLNRVFTIYSRFAKTLYGVPSHRPRTQSARDYEIWTLRSRGQSFGQIALKFHLRPNTAERAAKRWDERERKETERLLKAIKRQLEQTGFFQPTPRHIM